MFGPEFDKWLFVVADSPAMAWVSDGQYTSVTCVVLVLGPNKHRSVRVGIPRPHETGQPVHHALRDEAVILSPRPVGHLHTWNTYRENSQRVDNSKLERWA